MKLWQEFNTVMHLSARDCVWMLQTSNKHQPSSWLPFHVIFVNVRTLPSEMLPHAKLWKLHSGILPSNHAEDPVADEGRVETLHLSWGWQWALSVLAGFLRPAGPWRAGRREPPRGWDGARPSPLLDARAAHRLPRLTAPLGGVPEQACLWLMGLAVVFAGASLL